MEPTDSKGPGGSNGRGRDPSDRDTVARTTPPLSPAEAIASSRAAATGLEADEIELTEEVSEVAAAVAESGSGAAFEPPPQAAFRVGPSSSVMPVPPPFVPGSKPAGTQGTPLSHRPAAQPLPAPATGLPSSVRSTMPLAPAPAAGAHPVPGPFVPPGVQPPRVAPEAEVRSSMPSPPPPPAQVLPKVIISAEAYRPSQPPLPAAPPIPPPMATRPSTRPVPPSQADSGAPPRELSQQIVELPVEVSSGAADEGGLDTSEVIEVPPTDVEVLGDDETVAEKAEAAKAAPVARRAKYLELEGEHQPSWAEIAGFDEGAGISVEGLAADEVTPVEEQSFVPEATPPEMVPRSGEPERTPGAEVSLLAGAATGEGTDVGEFSAREPEAARASTEPVLVSDLEATAETQGEPFGSAGGVAAGDGDAGLGDLLPSPAEAPWADTTEPFASPVPITPADNRLTAEEQELFQPDKPPSVIAIPEDDVPRSPISTAARLARLGEAAFLRGVAPQAEVTEEVQEVAEELGEADVQSLEGEEFEPSAAPVIAPERPRPSAEPRPRARRRRRYGERRPWWEEIFDEEYIRSLPRYSANQTRREVEFIERSLGIARGARVLDVGCGDGRHAVELALRGFEVVGLDLSVPMLARAGDRAQARAAKLNFIQGDMRDLRFDAAFDAAYCVGSTFGYFDDDTNTQVLAGIARALKPGGRFLLQVCNRDHVWCQQPRSVWFEGDDRQYLEESDFNFINSRLVVKRSWVTSTGEQETIEYAIRLYSLHEMGKMFHAVGFRVIEVSGWFATPGAFLGGNSPDLILLAEKP